MPFSGLLLETIIDSSFDELDSKELEEVVEIFGGNTLQNMDGNSRSNPNS